MPFDLRIIRPSDFIRLSSLGTTDFESSKAALREVAHACRKRGIFRAILDLRDLTIPEKPLLNTTELAALVETFHDAGFTRAQRLAVLYRRDPHHGARMFAFISTMKGWQVRAFDDFEKALSWLSIEDDAPPIPTTGEQIPIQFDRADQTT
jgi:hypothetical protein